MANKLMLLIFVVGFALCVESKYMVYNTSAKIVPDKLNVHLVPHSHDDVGWLKTVDQYYVGSNNSIQGACVQNVLDSLIPALLADENRKFIYVEQAFFQRWWRDQSPATQKIVRQLVDAGQLEFINGGWCMHDEAATHYIDMIDQTTLGHRYIKEQFNVTPRIGWQIDPFGHSAVQAYLLGAELGFDSFFFGRIDYQDRAKRKAEKALEVVWQGSKSLGSSAQIFAGAFPENYEPPSGFYFEVNDDSDIVQDDMNLFDYNVQDRVNDFVAAAFSQANITRTNHVMWTMGTDFKYQYARTWFRNMDKLIHYVNEDGRVNALYSTPSIYTEAKYASKESWPLKTDDYFPYADRINAYWTGYFTSRPAIKHYVRILSGYYLAARQLESYKLQMSIGVKMENNGIFKYGCKTRASIVYYYLEPDKDMLTGLQELSTDSHVHISLRKPSLALIPSTRRCNAVFMDTEETGGSKGPDTGIGNKETASVGENGEGSIESDPESESDCEEDRFSSANEYCGDEQLVNNMFDDSGLNSNREMLLQMEIRLTSSSS
nr:probable alpha-mannosidase At5g13980 [Coffea arabica]